MTNIAHLILRHVRPFGGPVTDIAIRDQHIVAIGEHLGHRGPEVEGNGRDVITGLADHHLHLFATAAKNDSVDLSELRVEEDIIAALRSTAISCAPHKWVRGIGFVESDALPDRYCLDQWLPDQPLRIQARTGGLWLLNSAALATLGPGPWPDCVECSGDGRPTGRIWRGDEWLRRQIGGDVPSLLQLSSALAALGITSVTDAGAHNGPAEAALFEAAFARGELMQKLTLMGREDVPLSHVYARGPLKLLYDETDLPEIGTTAARIRCARDQNRAVAAHAVTLGELLFFLAALEVAGGARPGDRIEHGSMIPLSLTADIAKAGLTVVTQPDFVRTRGDRYRTTISSDEQPDLYRLHSLAFAGISMRAGSDAPYGDINPWAAIDAAIHRRTATGLSLGPEEALTPMHALSLYLTADRIKPGMPADLCLLERPLAQLNDSGGQSPVCLTLIDGQIVYAANGLHIVDLV